MYENEENALEELFIEAKSEEKSLVNSSQAEISADAAYREKLQKMREPLDINQDIVLQAIVNAPDAHELQNQFDAFNLNQAKKDAIRLAKLATMRDAVEDQMAQRLERHPDWIDNKTLVTYYDSISDQIDSAKDKVTEMTETAPIKTRTSTNVNINVGPTLDRESRDKVIDIVSLILKQAQAAETVVDAEYEENQNQGDNNISDAE